MLTEQVTGIMQLCNHDGMITKFWFVRRGVPREKEIRTCDPVDSAVAQSISADTTVRENTWCRWML